MAQETKSPVLRVVVEIADTETIYNLAQTYRFAPTINQAQVRAAYLALVDAVVREAVNRIGSIP